MDHIGEEQLDYGDGEYGGSHKVQYHGNQGGIHELVEDDMMGDDDDYDDLYNDVNVGDGFLQTIEQRHVSAPQTGHGLLSQRIDGPGVNTADHGVLLGMSMPGIATEGRDNRMPGVSARVDQPKNGPVTGKAMEQETINYSTSFSQVNRALEMSSGSQMGAGFRGDPTHPPLKVSGPMLTSRPLLTPESGISGKLNAAPLPTNQTSAVGNHPVINPVINEVSRPVIGSIDSNGPTVILVGELQWWTTDAELESALSQYGRVKEINFFDERASGKSKGYCKVEFYDPVAAASCKAGMNGYVFNGRACVVTFASAETLKQMGSGYMKRNQIPVQSQGHGRFGDNAGRGGGMHHQGGDGGRNYGNKAGWGRGGQGMPNRGQGNGGYMRGRGAMGPKGIMGMGAQFGQGLTAPAMMHPQNIMATGFDPTYMGRGGGYGGFPAAAFPPMMPSFPTMNPVGLPGVAPHVNPAFFGRGMMQNGMGLIGSSGMDGNSTGMWGDPGMGWTAEEPGRTKESSFGGDDVGSDYGYGEATQERGGRSNASREKDVGSERDWSGSSGRKHSENREQDRDRSNVDRHSEGKDVYRDHRQRDRDYENEDRDRGQYSRSRNKSEMKHEDDYRSRSRDTDYGKRRRE